MADPVENAKSTLTTSTAVTLSDATVILSPPRYTAQTRIKQSDLAIRTPEGTLVSWRLGFSSSVQNAALVFPGGDTTILNQVEGQYIGTRKVTSSSFYQVTWSEPNGSEKQSDYFEVEVVKDQPPRISIEAPKQFTELTGDDGSDIKVTANIADDYGVAAAQIIATVSKGSGEAVKFREEQIPFTNPRVSARKSQVVGASLDLKRLGLTPGDELYFYIEVFDNKTPHANRTRTETYFIALRDTAEMVAVADAGVGVDILPAYFRSQRQIIIDSEKLIREKKTITQQAFNSKSNELGYDQKVLRLKYGEFLGEEFESGIGPLTAQHAEDGVAGDEEDIIKQFGHDHDKDNEHNLVPDKPRSHDHEEGDDSSDPLSTYMHNHDSEEEATFFTQSIRAKLKAALTIMWDAELYLRLYQPEKSLPYQYRALALLKEISQDARVYVHRTGFDAPPLKEENRLTGDLTELADGFSVSASGRATPLPQISKALQMTELAIHQNKKLTPLQLQFLSRAGDELARLAVEEPGQYLVGLSIIRQLTLGEIETEKMTETLSDLRRILWSALPRKVSNPVAHPQTPHQLDEHFLQQLDKLTEK
jgi:hypothetical protein